MKNIMRSAIFALAAVTVGVASAETVVSAETEPFRLSIKHDGVRESGGEETLTYGATWHGGAGATVTLTQDGAELVSGLTGEGTNHWSVSRNGTYVLTHQTIENGDVTNILTATFVVSRREIPVAELTVDWDATEGLVYDGAGKMPAAVVKIGDEVLERGVAYTITYEGNTNAGTAKAILSGIEPYTGAVTNEFSIASRAVTLTSASREWTYDGAAHSAEAITIGGAGFVAGEGVTTNGFATITDVGTAPNAFSYAFASGTKAENYAVTCVTGVLSVVKAVLPPVDDPDPIDPGVDPEDPEQREDPDVRFSAFDYVGVYDGDEHTIDTNALKAAYETVFGESVTIGYMDNASGAAGVRALPPIVVDAAVTSFWYKVSSANYNDIVHPCKVVITNRAVTLTSASREWTYDGAAHSDEAITIGGMGFVAGEGVTTNGFATITNVGTAPNAFSYAFASGTRAENYVVTCVTGTLTIVKAVLPPVDDPDPIDPSVDPEDPEQREDPDVRFSVFDYVGVYDGEAHTIDTNALKAAYADKFLGNVPSFSYATTSNGVYQADAFAFTDVIVTSFWYKVSAANFDDIVHPCKVAITNRAVTLTSASREWTYDGAAHSAEAITIGGMGFVAGEGVTTNGFATITDVGTAPNAFSYAFASGTRAENYVVTCVTGTLSVVKAVLPPVDDPDPIDPSVDPEDPEQRDDPDVRFSAFDYVGVYDGEAHTIDTNALKVAYETVFGESVTIGYMDDASGAAGVRALPPIVRDAAVTSFWYKVSSANYNDVVKPCKIAITNRAVTVTVVGHSISPFYDTTEKTVSGYDISTEDELYDVETMTTFSGTAAAKRTDVGTTSMGLKAEQFANTNPNFAVTYDVIDGGVTIVARVIGDDDANWDIRLDKAPMYNGEEQNAPIIQVCYVKPDGNLDYIPYDLEGNVATNAGNYKVKIIGKGNYSGSVEKDWAIMPRNVTLTSGSAVWEYDGTTHVTNVVEVSGDGFVDGDGATYAGFPEVTHVADAATPVDNAFTYTLNENTEAQNYVINVVNGTVKMTKRPVTLTAPTKTKTYDGAPLTFGAEEVEIGGEGCADGEAFTFSNFASIIEAGQTAATFAIADGTALQADYDITVTHGATLTVTKSAAEITITAKNGEWTYDGVAHTLHEYEATNFGTLLAGDELEVTFDEASVVTTPVDGEGHNGQVENKIVSVKVIRTSGTVGTSGTDVSANYTLAWYPGMLTVKKRPVTLTSKDAAKTYDGTPLTKHEVEVGGDGFVGDDGASYEFTGSQKEKGKSANAFTYTLDEGTNAAYYDITKVEGELEVTAADIGEAEDDDWQVVLGPALTYTGIAQIQTVTSVQFKGLDVDYSVTGNQQTDAGVYEMTLAGQGNFTGTKKVAWAIAPKALTLTAGSATKTYDGTPLVSGAVTADGFVAGESATYACTGALTDVGSSENAVGTITWTAAKESNYAVTKKPGTLTVTTRPVKVTSKNVSKPYDGTALALTAADVSADNIVAGESFVYSDFASRTEAGQTSATFSVAAGANTKLSNYAITPVYGTITITKSATEIGVTAASETWTYDGEAHSNRTWTATNLDVLQSGDVLEVTFDEASVVTTPLDGEGHNGQVENKIVSAKVIRTGGTSGTDVTDNYTVTAYPGLLTMEKRPVTVEVSGETVNATYDGEEHTASGYDISTDDELYDIETMTAFGGSDEVSRTDVGKSEMGLKAGDFTNSDECFDVTYSVTDGSVEIAPADVTVGLEDDFVIALGANPKYNGTVQMIPVTAVTYKGLPVTCDLAGENATHAGTYTLTVKAKGNFTGERSVTWQILKRQVTLISGSASRVYNGQPLVNGTVTVSGDGFIGVEGATFETSGSQTAAGSTKNTFAYTLKAGTLAGDYDITKIEGDLTVTKATFDPRSVFPGLETATDEEGILCERVFNGKPQQFEVEVSESFTEAYEILYAVTPGAWSSVAPTQTNVSEGDLKVLFKFVSANFEPYEGFGTLRIVPKELTNEFIGLVLPPEDYVYDGNPKVPEVSFGDGDPSILTEDDWEVSYENNTDAGTATATFTGKGNYSGECYEDFEILKADNEWTTAPSIGNWTYGQSASTPVSAAKVGTATVTYSSGSVPTMPGDYTATFTVAESDNYNELTATVDFKILSATISCVADGSSGEYCGEGYGITVNVSTPASGYTIKYAESEGGPWLDEVKYVNVCTDKPIYYQVTATGYETKTGSAKVTVTPKELTNEFIGLVLPPEDYVYDGNEKKPEVAFGDGDPSILTEDDWEVAYSNNVNAGTATAYFTGKGNYMAGCTEDFVIMKADITDGGEEPGGGIVPAGGVSKFDATYEYDGETHTIKTNEIVSAFAAKFAEKGLAAPSAVKYSMDWNGTDGSWSDSAPGFVDVIVTSVWYKVCSADANYEDFIHESKLTITPRDLANVTVADIVDQTHTGTAIEPTVTVTDGDPSIVTADDYDIVYSDNVEIGEATVTLTGKNNYSGTKVAHFQIVGDSAAIISAQVAWTLLKASGTYLGQLKVTCTSGLASGIDKLEFLFADRMNGGDVVAALWDTPHRAVKATAVTYGGETYRFVALDPSLITAENVPVTFGVNDLAATTIPVAERTIELYVKKRVDPTNGNAATAGVDDFVGYVGWVSGGVTNYLPVVAGAQAASLARASLVSAAPMRLSAVNTALAVGTVVDAESSPYCKLVEFAVDGDEIVGRVEVGAVTDAGTESVGAIGDNATVELLGAKTLAEGFDHLATVKTDDKGYFRIKRPGECQFFKLKLSISNVVD